jgi:hypothetical protein
MPFKFEWVDEPYIYRTDVMGQFTAEDLEGWIDTTLSYLDSQPYRLYALTVVHPGLQIKTNILKHPRLPLLVKHPSAGWTVVVGITPMVAFLMQSLQRMTNLRAKTASNVEDALYFLRELRIIEEEQRKRKLND